MPQAYSNGIVLDYVRSGPADGEPLLLIHGVGAQRVRWSPVLLAALQAAGFHLIRFDNRDVGLSTHLTEAGVPDLAAVMAAKARGLTPILPYTLSDMAADTAGLLDALEIDSAHVMGVSLGGMIAQVLAIEHRTRVRSLTLVMTQSGNPGLPGSGSAAMAALTAPAPDPGVDLEGYLQHSVALNRALGSPAYPAAEADLRDYGRAAAARAYDPVGAARQHAAGRGSADRRPALAVLDAPTLVIHGADDPLVPVTGGQDLAQTIPRALLLIVQGMGHDLPDPLADVFVSALSANARRPWRRAEI